MEANLKYTDEMIGAIFASCQTFAQGKVSLEMWLKMSSAERSMMAGAIAGNAATHHPEITYRALQEMVAEIKK